MVVEGKFKQEGYQHANVERKSESESSVEKPRIILKDFKRRFQRLAVNGCNQ